MYPWLLLLIIPLVLISIYPYFKLPVKHRKSRNRITSMVLHLMIISLLVIVLSGMKIHNNYVSKKSDVMILVDQSTSQMSNQDDIDAFLEEVVAQLPNDYRIGIITFGKNTVYVSEISRNKTLVLESYYQKDETVDGSTTHIEDALLFAQSQLEHKKNGRIILVSDGRQTDGNAINAARNIALDGTRVDVKFIMPKHYESDAQITDLMIPNNPQRGANTHIEVVVDSDVSTEASLTITYKNNNGETTYDTQAVSIEPGQLTFGFDYVFRDFGLTEIKVELTFDENEDTVLENNVYFGFVDIKSDAFNRILIIEGVANDGQVIDTILTNNDYDVTRLDVGNLPTSLSELTMYQEIILVNVKNSDLTPTGFEALLNTYVKNYGGGLLTIGGDRAYQQSDMAAEGVNRTFDQLLPVESNTDPKSMAVVIVLDASGSMSANNSNKFQMAKEGAKASIQALYDSKGDTNHMFGVVTFDANLRDVIEMTSVDNIASVHEQIDMLTTGHGTQYTQGLQKARDMLNDPQFNNAQKHIIFLTDGGPQDSAGSYNGILNSLTDISVSTIALGVAGENELNPQLVEGMVRVYNNRGAYYRVTDQTQLYNIMLTDTEQAQIGDFINEETFTGVFTSILPAFAAIGELIPLDGYYGTRVRPNATMVVKTQTDDPLYVEWRPTATSGKVGSFMTDLNGREDGFSKDFVQHFIGQAFILGMVKSVLPQQGVVGNNQLNISYANQNESSTFRIRTNLNADETIRASIIHPNGNRQRISLSQISGTTFSGTFKREEPGIYTLEVTKYDGNGQIVFTSYDYSAYAYSDEFINAFDEETSIVLMEDIAINGGGQYLLDGDNFFTIEAQTISETIDPSTTLIIVSLILFLLDIVARKFKFKWPHEFFNKKGLQSNQI